LQFRREGIRRDIQGLSSQADTTAIVDFKGKVDDRSPFSVSGKINPLAKDIFADVTVTFTNTDLTSFTPYTEKFAGRPLQKGQAFVQRPLSGTTNALKAENGFYVDQLTLGPKNNSPDATSLPVKLAIATAEGPQRAHPTRCPGCGPSE